MAPKTASLGTYIEAAKGGHWLSLTGALDSESLKALAIVTDGLVARSGSFERDGPVAARTGRKVKKAT